MGRKVASGIMLTLILGSMLFSAIMMVEGETETHDLEVSLTTAEKKILFRDDGKGHLSSGNSTVLNATVVNKGEFNESDVVLQILIDGKIVLSAITPILAINHTFWAAYFWAPPNADYNLTAYAPRVNDEDNIANNNVTKWVRVCPDQPPIANFTYSPPPPLPGPVAGENVTFDASTSHDDLDWGNITIYSWNFNWTTFRNETSPVTTHKFPKHGNATVILTLYDTENKNDSTSANIMVYARPVADFTISGEPYVDHILTFNGTKSKDPDGNITSYFWDFDDGFNGTDPIMNHTFTTTGTYYPKLTVTDNDNLTDFETYPYPGLYIDPGYPKAYFEIIPDLPYYSVNDVLTFNASKSTADGGKVTSYFWNWNDGTPTNTTTSPVITHNFTQPSTYNVTLIVADSDNKISLPTVKKVIVKLRVLLEVKPTPVSSNPGENFNVSITVINVEDLFSAVFNLTWPGGMHRLIDVITAYPGNFTEPLDWFDPEPKPAQGSIWVNATRDVSGTGVYGNWTVAIISFKVRDRTGNHTLHFAESSLNTSRIAHSTIDGYFYTSWPVADFTYLPDKPVVDTEVWFNASRSYDPDGGNIVSYEWDFGDGNVTAKPDSTIAHRYDATGKFNVNLTVTDDELNKWWINYTIEVLAGRDIAVISIEPCIRAFNEDSGMYETAGRLFPIKVTVKNNGTAIETFNVIIYFNDTDVNKTLVTGLLQGESWSRDFYCNISKVTKGVYIVKAYAEPVPDEKLTDDNTFVNGTVRVYLQGDVDHNNKVEIFDVVKITTIYGKSEGDQEYYRWADLNCNGEIDLYDLVICTSNYGKKDP